MRLRSRRAGRDPGSAGAIRGIATRVAIDDQQQHIALPHLYGAPAYGRPPKHVDESPRPFDPDALPLAADMTAEERAYLATVPDRAWIAGGGIHLRDADDTEVRRSA